MLEEQLAYYLEKYLGNYVQGLSKEALKVSVWQGNVELTNMHLKPEALNALKLPIKVKAGFLGSVKLKVRIEKSGRKILESCRLYCPRSWIELSFGACCLYHHTQSTV
jgi:vacuolar protein sorting-associated protein 13A/C